MDIPVTEAKARLSELIRRAEAGEDIVLTRHGKPAARIVPAAPPPDARAPPRPHRLHPGRRRAADRARPDGGAQPGFSV